MSRGIALLALQKGPKTGQAGEYYGRAPLINIGAEIEDYDDTMAILDNLDLLVTVDTSVAHLAGAMGRPVWIMLPRAPDWRWLLERTDTPWYPTVRLFRQQTVRRWDDVAQAIAAELAATRGRRGGGDGEVCSCLKKEPKNFRYFRLLRVLGDLANV